jgi:hypothetical protein
MAIWLPAAGAAAREGAKFLSKRALAKRAATVGAATASGIGAKASKDMPERKARTRDPVASRSRTSRQRDR